MLSQATLKRHAGLVDRMATRVGIDLEDAALRGEISISEIDDAVLRCTGCTQADTCAHLLDSPAAQDAAAPDYCRNGEVFAALKG